MIESTVHVLRIDAIVDERERPAVAEAARQLGTCLSRASDATWRVDVRFRGDFAAIDSNDAAAVLIVSLLPELQSVQEPIASTQMRWQRRLSSLPGDPPPQILICTIFRHVAMDASNAVDARAAIRERIRRLDLMALELSHDTGGIVVDIDRALSHVGARTLQTDYRLAGERAASAVGHVIASSVLAAALDAVVTAEVQERAAQGHGQLRDFVDSLAASATTTR
ncbi:MAG TPA: hypothetical protein VMV45_00785 [Casimicrobiaceae bacterium]|nr:hypothetical protein [Casimicrobiaceae bacterium]